MLSEQNVAAATLMQVLPEALCLAAGGGNCPLSQDCASGFSIGQPEVQHTCSE